MTTMLETASSDAPSTLDRLLVTVREPETRRYLPVGFLCRDTDGYRFSYFRSALVNPGFRPLPGLVRAIQRPMRAGTLFPIFAERVMSARRPDRSVSMDALGLPMDAAPFEVLTRSHGQRVGDTIELLPAPIAAPGAAVSFTFLTHGVRHLQHAEQEHIASLEVGQRVRLVHDRENLTNSRALLVTDEGDVHLGWVPDPLIDLIEPLTDHRLTVERANGPEVGFHFRLLVRIAGRAPAVGSLFDGPEWETLQD